MGTSNIRQLIKDLKVLQSELRGDIPADIQITAAGAVADMVRGNIASIPDVDGNYLGTDNPNASVAVRVGPDQRHDVVWTGKQIAFVEFGTGATGAAGGYAGVRPMGYAPDPTKKEWVYRDRKSGNAEVSYGLAPQAPMLDAALEARRLRVLRSAAAYVLNGVIRRAITVR